MTTVVPVTLGMGAAVLGASLCAGAAANARRSERALTIAGAEPSRGSARGARSRFSWPTTFSRKIPMAGGLAGAGGLIGLLLAGPFAALVGGGLGAAVPSLVEGRRDHRRRTLLERQLADLAETMALGIRSGLSPVHAMDFARQEAAPPMSDLLARVHAERELGASFQDSLDGFARAMGTDEAQLLVLVLGLQARSGGSLAEALDEVAATIRHRVAIRRELRALSAQGRISGAMLGALPIGFFLILAATSHRELAPVYRSPAGIAMIGSGLTMQALAYLWIKRLMRVEV